MTIGEPLREKTMVILRVFLYLAYEKNKGIIVSMEKNMGKIGIVKTLYAYVSSFHPCQEQVTDTKNETRREFTSFLKPKGKYMSLVQTSWEVIAINPSLYIWLGPQGCLKIRPAQSEF